MGILFLNRLKALFGVPSRRLSEIKLQKIQIPETIFSKPQISQLTGSVLALALSAPSLFGFVPSAQAEITTQVQKEHFSPNDIFFQAEDGTMPPTAPGRGNTLAEMRFKVLAKQADKSIGTTDAAAPLIEINKLEDRLPELAGAAHLFQRHCNYRKGDQRMRELACYLQATVEQRRGRIAKANHLMDNLGATWEFQILGPFDNEGKSSCHIPLPPETQVDLSVEHQGKEHPVRWRSLPQGRPNMAWIDFENLFTPSSEILGYAYTELVAEKDLEVMASLGGSGAVQVFLDGVKVADDSKYHQPGLEHLRLKLKLSQGRHQLLIKLCGSQRAPILITRFMDATGKVPPELKIEASDLTGIRPQNLSTETNRGEGKKSFRQAKRQTSSVTILETLADTLRPKKFIPTDSQNSASVKNVSDSKGKFSPRTNLSSEEAKALKNYALVANEYEPDDETARTPIVASARAAESMPRDLEILQVAAALADKWEDAQRFLKAMLEADPGNAWAAERLAARLASHGQPRRALELLENALSYHPEEYALALEKAALLRAGFNMVPAADQLVNDLLNTHPDRPLVLQAAAEVQDFHNRPADSVSLRRTILSLNHMDIPTRRILASTLADMGDLDGALAERRRLVELLPWSAADWLVLGRLAGMNGLEKEALEALNRSMAVNPEDARIFERAGRILASMGKLELALKALNRSLELKPQNTRLKESIRSLSKSGSEKVFGEDMAVKVADLLTAYPPRQGEDVQVLQQLTAIQVHPNGLASRYLRTVSRALTKRGVEMLRQQGMAYSEGRQSLKLLSAKIHKPDGTSSEAYRQSARTLSDESSSMYYDVMLKVVLFPSLAPGDILEISWKLDDVAGDNLLSDYFGDVHTIKSEAFKERFDYAIRMPPGRPLYASVPEGMNLRSSTENTADGGKIYRFRTDTLPSVTPEPSMPGFQEVARAIHVSTFENWEDVSRYYAGLIRDQLTVTDRIHATLKDILKDLPNPKDRLAIVKAVYSFVVSRTRYVALEFGIHSFKPYPADKVLARKFGDCKDKASLIHVLLKAAGIDSSLVLLRTNRNGALDSYPASLAIFDHAILYVPEFDLFLDGTAEHHGTRELPTQDTGAQALIVNEDGTGRFIRIPPTAPAPTIETNTFTIDVSEDGSAEITGDMVSQGAFAAPIRRGYQASANQNRLFEKSNEHLFPGLTLQRLKVTGLNDIESPTVLTAEFKSKRFCQKNDDGSLRIRPFGVNRRTHTQMMATLANRTLPLVIQTPYTKVIDVRLRLPPRFKSSLLPSPIKMETPRIHFEMRVIQEADETIRFQSTFTVKSHRVEPADYPSFRDELLQVDDHLNFTLTAERLNETTFSKSP